MPSRRKKPPSSNNGGDEEHRRRLDECKTRVAAALAASTLSETKKREYAESMYNILEAMTPTALARHHANTKGYAFYDSHRALTDAFLAKYPDARHVLKGTLKGVFDRDGTLHLDGGGTLFGRQAPIREFQAHETTHSIDGIGHEISRSEEWLKAWSIEKDLLMGQGKRNATEGLAEFGQMLLGDPRMTRKLLRKAMPKCMKVWEGYGL